MPSVCRLLPCTVRFTPPLEPLGLPHRHGNPRPVLPLQQHLLQSHGCWAVILAAHSALLRSADAARCSHAHSTMPGGIALPLSSLSGLVPDSRLAAALNTRQQQTLGRGNFGVGCKARLLSVGGRASAGGSGLRCRPSHGSALCFSMVLWTAYCAHITACLGWWGVSPQ